VKNIMIATLSGVREVSAPPASLWVV